MKIAIGRQEGKITTIKQYSDIESREELSMILTELELIKLDILDMYEGFDALEEDE